MDDRDLISEGNSMVEALRHGQRVTALGQPVGKGRMGVAGLLPSRESEGGVVVLLLVLPHLIGTVHCHRGVLVALLAVPSLHDGGVPLGVDPQ